MPIPSFGEYPPDWNAIALRVKEDSGWKCERCHHPHDPKAGYTLTTHHLDGNKGNCADWNLAALCQRCHLSVQGRINLFQSYMFTLTPWFQPHYQGFLEAHRLNPTAEAIVEV